MSNQIEITKFKLPAYWASALINNDESGMSDDDIEQMSAFLEKEKPGHCVECSDESHFAHSNYWNNIGGDVLEYSFQQ